MTRTQQTQKGSASGSTLLGALETVALVGAAVLITMPAWKGISRRWRLRHPHAATESMIDEALEETFPASDPPATRIFEIPANRR
jgi:hypothetical protein